MVYLMGGLTTHSTRAEIAWMSFARIEGFLQILPAALIRALDGFYLSLIICKIQSPMNIEQKIIDRFQQLIDFEAEMMKTRSHGGGEDMFNPPYDFVSKEQAYQWGVSCLHIIKRVFSVGSDHYAKFNAEFPNFSNNENYYHVKRALGILKAAKDDFENGYLKHRC